jgi:tetratricopeptide (TPR) repeat protein
VGNTGTTQPTTCRANGHALALGELAELQYRLGDWPGACATAAERLRAASGAGLACETMTGLAALAMVEAGLGREDECREHATQALELGRRHASLSVQAVAAEALGRLELGLERLAAAIGWLERASRIRLEHREPCTVSWPEDLADAWIRRGERSDALRAVSRLEEWAGRSGSYVLVAASARSAGALATDDRYERHFERALEWSARAQHPFSRARTELAFGERLLREGRDGSARERLGAAVDGFETLRSRPWADRARQELGRCEPAGEPAAWARSSS